MASYLIRRFLALIPTWIAIGIIAFALIRLAPGDPAAAMLSPDTLEGIDKVRERLGLDQPWWVQLYKFILNASQGYLGESFFLGRSVTDAIIERLPTTGSLAGVAIVISVLIGVPAGIAAALRPNSLSDTAIMAFAMLGLSLPSFFAGLILIFFFAVGLGWMPAGGFVGFTEDPWEWFRHIIMPAFSLGFVQCALIARMTRSSMLEVMSSDYIRTAYAKGLPSRSVVWLHAFKNAMIPVVTVVGVIFALLLSGAFITEVLFRLPGVGSLIISAVKRRDYPIVQGGLLVFSSSVLLINVIVDVAYAWLDPRIKYS